MDIVPAQEVVSIDDKVEIEFFNKENKKSVYNLMPNKWRKILDEREVIKEELEKDEWEIKKSVKMSPTLNRLRYSFWNEYYRAVDENKSMVQQKIFAGVCSYEAYDKLTRNNANVAWILCPPADTVISLRETLNYGLDKVREILDLPLYKTESVRVGSDTWEDREVVDEKVANLMLKAVAMVDLRLHGSYVQVQKIEQKTMNINKNVTNVENSYVESNKDSIDAQLEMLRKEVKNDVKKLEAPLTIRQVRTLQENDIEVEAIGGVKATTLSAAGTLDLDDDLVDL